MSQAHHTPCFAWSVQSHILHPARKREEGGGGGTKVRPVHCALIMRAVVGFPVPQRSVKWAVSVLQAL